MLTLIMSFGIIALSLLLRLAHKLRLTLHLLYAVLVPTIFRSWYLTHPALSAYLFCALLAVVVASWLGSLWRIVSDAIDERTTNSAAVQRFTERVRSARANGESVVSTEGLW